MFNWLLKQSGSISPSGTVGNKSPTNFGLFWPIVFFLIATAIVITVLCIIEKIKSKNSKKENTDTPKSDK